MKLKEASELKDKIEKYNKEIEESIYNILYDILREDYADVIEVKKQYKLWENLLNNEFSFDFPFGNIGYKALEKINSGFKEEGWKISAIISNDIYEKKKGFQITFTKG